VDQLGRRTALTDIHRMPTLLTLRLQLSTDFGNANSSTRGLPCTQAGDIGASRAGNAAFVIIQTHLSFGFCSDAKQSSASRRCGRRKLHRQRNAFGVAHPIKNQGKGAS
jgi:hypothetical protein